MLGEAVRRLGACPKMPTAESGCALQRARVSVAFLPEEEIPECRVPGIPLQVSHRRKPQGKRRRASVHASEAVGR